MTTTHPNMPTSSQTAPKPSSSAQTLKLVRKLHLYFGLFIAPALLFFAFTGAMQTLSLHEAAGTSYTPPAWLAKLGQLHKDQNLQERPHRAPAPQHSGPTQPHAISAPSAATAAPKPGPTLEGKQREHLPEKLFFLVVAVGLVSSALSGIYMAYRYERNRLLVTGLLLAGVIVPLVLLPF